MADETEMTGWRHGLGPTAIPGGEKTGYHDGLKFEYDEHAFLGDAIQLQLRDGTTVSAKDHVFTLPNTLKVTYGAINGLAGDFYGTYDPISDGHSDTERGNRFMRAFETLAYQPPGESRRQPQEAKDILKVLQSEIDAINQALAEGQDPSIAYSKLPDPTFAFTKITNSRKQIPGYVGLARINWDHFGADARTAYNAGHDKALDTAVKGDLELAYAINAFADHFLEDSFSAGHLRTPRRDLHDSLNLSADYCAKLMHDEDCAIGLRVANPRREEWTAYGDKRALDEVSESNKQRCIDAVQASAREIYVAWESKKKPPKSEYQAWDHAPTLLSANGFQELAPLFQTGLMRRKDIEKRRGHHFTGNWWYLTTVTACKMSGWWKYPITIDGLASED